ncbi:hypothetical protein TWF103_009374 [Orbilia oligospora]|uniref:Uncharacterized protein n=1 Tax=Orbilia oligospora TaxID=2813651 RepID=A0A7C8JSX0_ORBOL|nr:hypothetical protein TWF103_009374 [Orbilia oligospora]KAF3137856.1 hypothetical protein TWF703_004826 [Orbilia oligospora]
MSSPHIFRDANLAELPRLESDKTEVFESAMPQWGTTVKVQLCTTKTRSSFMIGKAWLQIFKEPPVLFQNENFKLEVNYM